MSAEEREAYKKKKREELIERQRNAKTMGLE